MFAGTLAVGLSSSCDLLSGPGPEPTTVEVSHPELTFDALGSEAELTAEVLDQNGRVMPDAETSWSSADPEIASVSDAGLVTSAGNGATTITASAGRAEAEIPVSVQQVAASITIEGGDGQTGSAGSALPAPLEVRAFDSEGHVAVGARVLFSVVSGGGSVGDPETVTDGEGRASTIWSLGTEAGEPQRARAVGTGEDSDAEVVFEATALSGPPADIRTVSGGGQVANRFEVVPAPLVVRVEDDYGNPVPGAEVHFSVEAGGGALDFPRTRTGTSGLASTRWALGPDIGTQRVASSIEGGAQVTFVADALAGGGPGSFSIELEFLDEPTAEQRAAFEAAVVRWESIIVGDLQALYMAEEGGLCGERSPPMDRTIDDLLVFVTLEEIDGPGGTIGQAGVCWIRNSNNLPIVGQLRLDVDDLAQLENLGLLEEVIVHELGHVLGIGSLWRVLDLLNNPSLPNNRGADTHFPGSWAVAAFDAIGGEEYEEGEKVPVENEIGSFGTRDSHWRESVFNNELMTGSISAGSNPLSRVTIASLRDLGYAVDERAADSFTLDRPAAVPGVVPHIHLGDDVIPGPIRRIGESEPIFEVPELGR